MKMFIVYLNNGGFDYYLHNTVWSNDIDRATKFETVEAAEIALKNAKQFMKAPMFKKASIRKIEA